MPPQVENTDTVSVENGGMTAEELEASAIRELGVTESRKIDSGFVFLDGRYVEAPYTVSRKGRQVLLNGMFVWQSYQPWPLPDLRVNEDPGPPTEVYANAKSLDDLYDPKDPVNSHIVRKMRYLWQHFPDDIARQKMTEYVRQLPFAESVKPSPSMPDSLRVKIRGGGGGDISLSTPYPAALSFTNQDLVDVLEKQRQSFEDQLQSGKAVFVFPGIKESFASCLTSDEAAEYLEPALEVLLSTKSEAEKTSLLQRTGFVPHDNTGGVLTLAKEELLMLIRNFRASKQLDERLDELKKMEVQ